MKVKPVRSFYFYIQLRTRFGQRSTQRPQKLCCVIGTAQPPFFDYTVDLQKYYDKYEKFIKKPTVFVLKSGLGKNRISANILSSPYKIIGSDVVLGLKVPKLIGKRVTGPGSYFYYKSNLYLGESSSDVVKFVDGEPVASQDNNPKRDRIPDDVQIFVWNRDGGECVKCGSNENLAYDHIIPFSRGGSNSKRNLQILCDTCNSKKSNKIGG